MGKFADFRENFMHNFYDVKNNLESRTGLLTGIGVAAGLLGTVLACKATVKIVEKAEEHKKLVDDTKANCTELALDEKATHKEVMKAYRHIGVDYVRQYWPAVGLLAVGYGLIIRAHCLEVAKNEALMTAYIGLEQLFNKYRQKVAEQVGVEREQDIFKQAQIEKAKENVIGEYAGEYRNGSYLLYNENCSEYTKGCPQANDFMCQTIENEIIMKYEMGKTVYINDIMRAAGHPEIRNGHHWIWRKGLTAAPNFMLHDPDHNPEFAKGYGFNPNEEPIMRIYLDGCVHVSALYSKEFREYLREPLADGGVMGGEIGRDAVIIG